jgi:hypothetical protein
VFEGALLSGFGLKLWGSDALHLEDTGNLNTPPRLQFREWDHQVGAVGAAFGERAVPTFDIRLIQAGGAGKAGSAGGWKRYHRA